MGLFAAVIKKCCIQQYSDILIMKCHLDQLNTFTVETVSYFYSSVQARGKHETVFCTELDWKLITHLFFVSCQWLMSLLKADISGFMTNKSISVTEIEQVASPFWACYASILQEDWAKLQKISVCVFSFHAKICIGGLPHIKQKC